MKEELRLLTTLKELGRKMPGRTRTEAPRSVLIILSDADIAKVLPDPDFGAFIDKAAEHPEGVTAQSVKALFKNIEAMTIEGADQITVKLK